MKIKLDKYSVTPSKITLGTEGSYGVETLDFEFSTEWNGCTKTASFYPTQGDAVVVVISSTNTINVPQEFTAHKGTGKIVINGVKSGVSILSVILYANILETKAAATTPAGSPTQTEMQQVLTYLGEAESLANSANLTAQSVRDDADAGLFDGAKGDKGDKGDKGEKGDKGDKGDIGNNGKDGISFIGVTKDTEVTDWWTQVNASGVPNKKYSFLALATFPVAYGDSKSIDLVEGSVYYKKANEISLDYSTIGGGGGTSNYNSLINKPKINGTTLQGDITIPIPTKVSELDNDAEYITEDDIPTIPTKTSDLTNDSGYITSSYHDTTKQDTLSTDQMNAVNSGITSTLVQTFTGYGMTKANANSVYTKTEIDNKGYITDVSGKQDVSTLETDVKAFIDASYIQSLLSNGDEVAY